MNPTSLFNGVFQWLFDAILAAGVIAGAVVAYKQGFLRTTGETQEKAINAQQALIATLKTQIETQEKEKDYWRGIHETTTDILAQKGITLTVSGDMVTVDGANGKPSGIRRKPRPAPKKDTP